MTAIFEVLGDQRITERCATEGCGGQVTHRYEAGDVGSYYCSGCVAKLRALSGEHLSKHPGKTALEDLFERTRWATVIRCKPHYIREIADYIDMLEDKIDGLESDLDNAVETAFKRGATEWARLNYPNHPLVRKEGKNG